MNTIHPYQKQRVILSIIGLIGIIGTLLLILNLIFHWEMNHFSLGVYPIFLINFYQAQQMKQNNIHYSKESINWKLVNMEERKQIDLAGEPINITSDWKGISIQKGEEQIDISLDSVWQSDRKRIVNELRQFYTESSVS